MIIFFNVPVQYFQVSQAEPSSGAAGSSRAQFSVAHGCYENSSSRKKQIFFNLLTEEKPK